MDGQIKHPSFEVMVVISTTKQIEKAAALFRQGNIPMQYQFHAVGTATNEIVDALGLGSAEKCVLLGMLPQPFATVMLTKLQKELQLYTPASGIAFTIPMTGLNNQILRMLSSLTEGTQTEDAWKEHEPMKETNHSLVVAMVNQGFSEEVMQSAREAGARGGTVIPSRKIANADMMQFWGFSMQEETEIVLILCPKETKLAIMSAISKHCGVHSEAKGFVLSLPVDAVAGLESQSE